MRLSVITPSYNQSHLINQTIESVLNQPPGLDLEYIIIDGESQDNTRAVVEQYRPLFKKRGIDFVFISEPDEGQSDAINKGFALSTGELVTFLNSDDYYDSDILGKAVNEFTSHPEAQWGYGGYHYVDLDRNIYKTIQPSFFDDRRLKIICNIGQPSCFFRKEFLFKAGLLNTELHLAMDYDLWLRMANIERPIILPFPLANMRYYMGTKSASQSLGHLKEAFRLQCRYSHGFFLRLLQIFYFMRGFAVIMLKFDINYRVERARARRNK